MKPKIAEAFYKKFDEAVIMNLDNPFPQSLEESIMESGNSISTGLTYDNILALEDILSDEDFDTNAFISTKKNRSTLRKSRRSKTASLSRLCMTEQTIHWTAIR